MTDDPVRLAVEAGVPEHLARFGSPPPITLEDLEAVAEDHRAARAAECSRAGRHLDVVLEAGEYPRCRYCSASPLSDEDLVAVGVRHAPADEAVPRCCALDAIADLCAAFTAGDDEDARAQALEHLAAAEARHAGHSSAAGPSDGGWRSAGASGIGGATTSGSASHTGTTSRRDG